MAIIGKIRQRSWILVGFIALALLIFIVEAALERNSLFGGGGKDSVGKVNGKSISGKEYGDRIASYEEGLKLINPNMQFTDELNAQVREEVWNSILSEDLLANANKSLGLDVSVSEMADLRWGDQMHPLAQRFLGKLHEVKPDIVNQQTGQLDLAKVKTYIGQLDQIDKENKTNLRALSMHIEDLISDDQKKQKYASLVVQSLYVPKFLAKEIISSEKGAKVSFVSVPYTSLPDDKYKVTDGEIADYLEAHRAKYEQNAVRVVDVVSFDVVPSAADTAQAITEINKMREEYIAEQPKDSAFIARNSVQGGEPNYYTREEVAQTTRNPDTLFSLPIGTLTNVYKEGSYYMFTKILDRTLAPDTVRAAHILLSLGGKSDEEKAAAYQKADSLIKLIQSKAKNFGELAQENSLDQGSKDKGGDLGYFTRGQMVKPFNDKVFFSGMQPNQIATVESQYGLHIIILIEAKSPKLMTKFADFAVELAPSDETERQAYDKAVAFQQKNQTPEEFDKAAKTQKLNRNIVLAQNMVTVPEIGAARKMVQWAFQQDKPGVIKDFDTDGKFMIVKLSKVIPKGLPKPEDVRQELTVIIRNEKKGKDLVDQLNKAAAGTTDLAAIASKVKDAAVTDTALIRFSSGYVSNVGNEPKLVGTAFGIPVGKTSKAIAGDRGAFIVQTKEIEPSAPNESTDLPLTQQRMQRMFTSRLNFQSIFESIVKKSKVDDVRYKFY